MQVGALAPQPPDDILCVYVWIRHRTEIETVTDTTHGEPASGEVTSQRWRNERSLALVRTSWDWG